MRSFTVPLLATAVVCLVAAGVILATWRLHRTGHDTVAIALAAAWIALLAATGRVLRKKTP